ncbi:lipoprotein releasing system, transmembrane protein, LolC/E family [Thermodesulfatator indicus DSM 15286]|uniref:Lipoprotein releasing system, transmembrane protein, LolC/E family n=1 Tax=Thermodesulfatator indicus (strain DSM 15286 / JCM 11887 / CIR29812) TaxID=667014 RepID=F8ABH1_THEID|nr:ABC transporter permease [Thermodesulfatator indicus]AEH44486.1 lipoprotein releasing system, transmembrane protein, LolC/E family [Thermodesulfatator indicus DSM 15286]
MISRFEWYIAFRYLLSRKKHRFTSFISGMAILGVAIGVCALIVVISVMSGFQKELRDKLLGINAHVIVQKMGGPITNYQQVMQEIKGMSLKKQGIFYWLGRLRGKGEVKVEDVLPSVILQGMLSAGEGQSGVILRGVPGKEANKFFKKIKLKQGSFLELKGDAPVIILGWRLAKNLDLTKGDKVTVILPQGRATVVGFLPKMKTLTVGGIFETGLYEFDSSLAFIPLGLAQNLADTKGVSNIEVRITDPFYAGEFSKLVAKKLGFPYWVIDWRTMNASLFSALKLEKAAMFIILTLIIVVAAFNIVAALIMLVGEKKADIAILKTIGASDRSILKIFMLTGFLLGLSGIILGVLSGLSLCFFIDRYPIIKLPGDVYFVETLPVLVDFFDISLISISAIFLALLATVYPARQAAKLPPAEVLRYD